MAASPRTIEAARFGPSAPARLRSCFSSPPLAQAESVSDARNQQHLNLAKTLETCAEPGAAAHEQLC
jgi:hypothetical protein